MSNSQNDNPNQTSETDARLETLELKVMELENTISELNEVVLSQYRDHQTLTALVEQLTARLSGMSDNGVGDDKQPSLADEVPPHY